MVKRKKAYKCFVQDFNPYGTTGFIKCFSFWYAQSKTDEANEAAEADEAFQLNIKCKPSENCGTSSCSNHPSGKSSDRSSNNNDINNNISRNKINDNINYNVNNNKIDNINKINSNTSNNDIKNINNSNNKISNN